MILVLAAIAFVLHAALVLVCAPVLTGLLRGIQGKLLGRGFASPLQPWRELLRLSRKQPVLAEGASWLVAAAPLAIFTAMLAAALLVPSFSLGMLPAPSGDLLVIAGLLALGRGILALAAMDSGTAQAGMGASRAVGIAALAEPVLLLVIFTLALLEGSSNLDIVAAGLRDGAGAAPASLGLALLALIAVALAENAPPPFGDPTDMTAAFSGRDLALIEAAGSLKLLVWLSLIAAIFLPFGTAGIDMSPLFWLLGLLAWAVKLAGLTAGLAVLGGVCVAIRPGRVVTWLSAALLLAVLAALLLVGQGLA